MADEQDTSKNSTFNPAGVVTSAADYPTIFSDGCLFAYRMGGLIRMAFVESMIEAADGPFPGFKSRHVGTLVMTEESFQITLNYLNSLAEEWRKEDAPRA